MQKNAVNAAGICEKCDEIRFLSGGIPMSCERPVTLINAVPEP